MNNTQIGGLDFLVPKLVTWDRDKKRNLAQKIPLAPVRGAILGLVAINWAGLATSFSLLRKDPSGEKQLNAAWYNFGGNNSYLNNAIRRGENKKAKMFLAPQKIKKAYIDALGKNSIDDTEIKDNDGRIGLTGAEVLAAIKLAMPIIKLFVGLVVTVLVAVWNKKRQDKQVELDNELQREINRFAMEQAREKAKYEREQAEKGFDFDFSLTDSEGNVTTAGYGLIGVGVLAALIIGTKKKGKKLF